MTYSGGQRSARRAPAPSGNVLQGVADFLNRAGIGISRSAAAAYRSPRVVPISSDQLPPGAYMKETGEVLGMSSEQVPAGGYMTETGRVYVPEGFRGFERQGPPVPPRIQNAPTAPILPPPAGFSPIVQGTRDGVTPDRTQSDEYKAQMAQYGALQKAKKFEEADKLGMEIWRSKYKDTPMAQEKGAVGAFNPLMKRTFPEQYGEPTMGPTPAALQADPALKGVTSFFPGAEPGGFTSGVGNPVTPTEAFNQGEVMDANRGVQNLQVWQRAKTNPQNYTSQQSFDPDTLARVSNFLSRY